MKLRKARVRGDYEKGRKAFRERKWKTEDKKQKVEGGMKSHHDLGKSGGTGRLCSLGCGI